SLTHPLGRYQAARTGTAWTVTVVDPGQTQAVATWTIDAHTGKVLGSARLPEPKPKPRLAPEEAFRLARESPKIASWLDRSSHVNHSVVIDDAQQHWTVHFYGFNPGKSTRDEIAQAVVDDATGKVTEAWTGPQVAWKMARGYDGAFGRRINDPWVWGLFCA